MVQLRLSSRSNPASSAPRSRPDLRAWMPGRPSAVTARLLSGLAAGTLAVLSLAAAGPAHASEGGLSGVFSLDYVPRWIHGTNIGDQDIYASVQLDWGQPKSHYSGSIYWRGVTDADGPSVSPSSLFYSVYDEHGGGSLGQLFYAYADVRSDGPVRLVRAGRQYVYQGQPFHFDGLKLRTRRGAAGFCASAFGGVPVHYFEESSGGDWLAGGGLELSPWPGAKRRAV